ncbi:MAG: MotA/TolQ/ExbB proton channel family protein [bacterium]
MYALVDILERIRDFFETGGPVLWPILLTALLMWTLIIERYWFLRLVYPGAVSNALAEWDEREDKQSWYAHQVRDMLVSRIDEELNRNLLLLKTLIAICPLLGLLGTVVGMVQVFEIMAVTGTTNARAMASGISMATIPTMSGMVVALSGLYFSARLQHHASQKTQLAAAQIEIHDTE